MVVNTSIDVLPNCFVVRFFLQLSAYIPDGPDSPLVLTAALFSSSMFSPVNLIGNTSSGVLWIVLFPCSNSRISFDVH